eukprot:gene2309-1446_t
MLVNLQRCDVERSRLAQQEEEEEEEEGGDEGLSSGLFFSPIFSAPVFYQIQEENNNNNNNKEAREFADGLTAHGTTQHIIRVFQSVGGLGPCGARGGWEELTAVVLRRMIREMAAGEKKTSKKRKRKQQVIIVCIEHPRGSQEKKMGEGGLTRIRILHARRRMTTEGVLQNTAPPGTDALSGPAWTECHHECASATR